MLTWLISGLKECSTAYLACKSYKFYFFLSKKAYYDLYYSFKFLLGFLFFKLGLKVQSWVSLFNFCYSLICCFFFRSWLSKYNYWVLFSFFFISGYSCINYYFCCYWRIFCLSSFSKIDFLITFSSIVKMGLEGGTN